MVFDRTAEVKPGIEEACDYGIMFCEEMDDCLQTMELAIFINAWLMFLS